MNKNKNKTKIIKTTKKKIKKGGGKRVPTKPKKITKKKQDDISSLMDDILKMKIVEPRKLSALEQILRKRARSGMLRNIKK